MNTVKIYTNYNVNGYRFYFGLYEIKGDVKSDCTVYKLPSGYDVVYSDTGSPAIKCPDGEIIVRFTDRQDRPAFITHTGKCVALKRA